MSYIQCYYHIVLRTKNSEKSLSQNKITDLYKYIWGITEKKKCYLYRINGMEEHLHLCISLHPSIALADFVKSVKVSANLWMKSREDFKNFDNWSEGYFACTCGHKDRHNLINYVKSQQEHHKKESFRDEMIRLFKEAGLDFDERFLL